MRRALTFGERRQLATRLRALPLERVLPLCGGQPDPDDRHKWRTPVGTLSVTGAKFMNWTLGAGGGGAIDLVIHLHRLDFKSAVDWLCGYFPQVLSSEPPARGAAAQLRLPPPAPGQLARVLNYLCAHRRLPSGLLAAFIQSGSLYADARANAVFLLRNEQDLPVGAELRGTTARPWRGLAPGSRKDRGCFAVPCYPPRCAYGGRTDPRATVVLCESAIDAISCWALHPGYHCLSTAGARPDPPWLRPLLDQGYLAYCGFDADPTGDAMAAAMVALYPSVQRLRPTQHDWNDVLKAQA